MNFGKQEDYYEALFHYLFTASTPYMKDAYTPTEINISPEQERKIETEKNRQAILDWIDQVVVSVKTALQNQQEIDFSQVDIDSNLINLIAEPPTDYYHPDSAVAEIRSEKELLIFLKGLKSLISFASTVAPLLNRKTGEKDLSQKGCSFAFDVPWLIHEFNEPVMQSHFEMYAFGEPDVTQFATKGSLQLFSYEEPERRYTTHTTEYAVFECIKDVESTNIMTVDDVLTWPKKKIRFWLENRKEIVEKLMQNYCEATRSLINKVDLSVELRKYDPKALVKEIRMLIPSHLRSTLAEFTNDTCQNALVQLGIQVSEEDKKRFELHRRLEAFCLIFEKKSKAFVAEEIIDRLEPADKIVPISNKVVGKFYSKRFAKDGGKTFEIFFGIGAGYSMSSDGYTAAPTIDYTSFIDQTRKREQDIELVNTLIQELTAEYPLLKMKNELYVGGSTHEKWAGETLTILDDSITNQAIELKISKALLITELVKFIKEKTDGLSL